MWAIGLTRGPSICSVLSVANPSSVFLTCTRPLSQAAEQVTAFIEAGAMALVGYLTDQSREVKAVKVCQLQLPHLILMFGPVLLYCLFKHFILKCKITILD